MRITKRVFSLFFLTLVIASGLAAATHAQAIEDWFKLRNYTPPANVAAIANQDKFTPLSTHIFYVNHPDLEPNASTFRKACPQSEQTIVLGCYHGGQMGIEVYDVQDVRLQGVQQVTAAHEMLHAAYDRLSPKEKQRVDAMLQDYYNNDLKDQRILTTIEAYKKSEPTELVNEMHSIFGTEVNNLPKDLQDYYGKYFTDRSAVTAYAASYEDEFTSRSNQIDEYDHQLASMKASITSQESSLRAQLTALEADRSRVESGGSQSDVNSFNARVVAYNGGVRQLQADISAYNNLVDKRNALAAELRSLQSSLDTRLTTQ